MLQPQSFSIPAGNALDVPLTSASAIGSGALLWQAFPQTCGVPDTAQGPLLSKGTGSGVTVSGTGFVVHFAPMDTATLFPGNVYFEATLTDASGNPSTVAVGTMTVTATFNDQPS